MAELMKFWAYRNTLGQTKVRRYFGPMDVTNAKADTFIEEVMEPFDCKGWIEAEKEVKEYFKRKDRNERT